MALWELALVALAAAAAAAASGLQRSNDDLSICARICPSREAQCPSPCQPCPSCPACPATQCPSLPEIPACAAPVVNLACPTPACPACPSCPRPTIIPQGYTTVPGLGTYKMYEAKAKWLDANVTCALDGGHLVVLNSPEELSRMLGMMVSYDIKYLHIGFHDTVHETEFLTVLGVPMDSVQRSFWADGEPNGGAAHNCVYLHREKRRILDEPCTDTESFACEISHI